MVSEYQKNLSYSATRKERPRSRPVSLLSKASEDEMVEEIRNNGTNENTLNGKEVPNIGFLASANFSMDSLAEESSEMHYDNRMPSDVDQRSLWYSDDLDSPHKDRNLILTYSKFEDESYINGNDDENASGKNTGINLKGDVSFENSLFPEDSLMPVGQDRLSLNEKENLAFYDTQNNYRGLDLWQRSSTKSSRSPSPVKSSSPNRRRLSNISLSGPLYSTYSRSPSPVRSKSPVRSRSPVRSFLPSSQSIRRPDSPVKSQPFNFKPQNLQSTTPQNLRLHPSHRKGHKYKHSSMSQNLFQEPPATPDVEKYIYKAVNLYVVPNYKEILASIKPLQKKKLAWVCFYASLSLFVYLIGLHLTLSSFSTLAHLIFYNSFGAFIATFVNIMANFEVWSASSLFLPFGLCRLEALLVFGSNVSLIMAGVDLISHSVEEFLISLAISDSEHAHLHHGSHYVHGIYKETTNLCLYELTLLSVLVASLITSSFILSHNEYNKRVDVKAPFYSEKTARADKVDPFMTYNYNRTSDLRKVFYLHWVILRENPTHMLTLIYSLLLVLIPLLPSTFLERMGFDMHETMSLVIAHLFCYIGWRLAKILGRILLLSSPFSNYYYQTFKSNVIDEILVLPSFKSIYSIERFYLTKFDLQTYVIGMRLRLQGASSFEESKLRESISILLKNVVSRFENDAKNIKIESTIDIDRI